MLETLSTGTASAQPRPGRAAAPGEPEILAILPRQPKTVRDTGLEARLVNELVVKMLHASGKTPLAVLTGKLKLSVSVLREVLNQLMAEQQVEVGWCGESDIDVQYQLTAFGQRTAVEYLAQSRYVGPAPVTLADYAAMVERQSLRRPDAPRLDPAELHAGLADEGLDLQVRELIGAALHSQRALLLYGPSGAGKTALAHKLARLLQGVVALPHAILVGREIVRFHDPAWHSAPAPLARASLGQEERRSCDARWAVCQRPVVHVGAELRCDMLELRLDAANGLYQAPPHFLANNGVFVVDDVGRQRMPAADLLNRWIAPLDQGVDHLSLQGGHSVCVPFDTILVFVTALAPESVFDPAFMRRIGYRIPVGPLSEANYRALLRRQCRLRRIAFDDEAVDYLLGDLHQATGRPLLAGYPHELLGRIADFASFAGTEPRLSIDSVEQAWISMFAGCDAQATAGHGQSILRGE